MHPKVSVVIPCFNCASTLKETISSVFDQTYKSMELIVIDDGSDDNTLSVAKSLQSAAPMELHIRKQENKGVAVARNLGVTMAGGEFVAFLDADDIWSPTKIERQIEQMEACGAVLSHTGGVQIDENGLVLREFKREMYLPDDYQRSLVVGNCIVTSTVLVKRSSLNDAGLFDNSLRYCEDLDLWMRLSKLGTFSYLDIQLLKYRVHENQAHGNIKEMRDKRLLVASRASDVFGDEISNVDELISVSKCQTYLAAANRQGRNGLIFQAALDGLRAIAERPLDFKLLRGLSGVAIAILVGVLKLTK